MPDFKEPRGYKQKPWDGFAKDRLYDKKQKEKEALEEKKNRAIKQGKIANWNKKNPNATQEEMNAFIQSLMKEK